MRKLISRVDLYLLFLLIGNTHAVLAKALEDYTLDEVLDGIADANGGIESIENVINVRLVGTAEGSDSSWDFVIMKRRPNLLRSRINYYDKVVETGFNGTVLWRRFEHAGRDKVEQLEDPGLIANMQIEADFDGPLIGLPQQGINRRLGGIKRIDRVDYFVIEVLAGASRSVHYVDSRTFREMQVLKTIETGDADPITVVTKFHSIQRHGGIWIAMRMEKEFSDGRKETLLIKQVEINPGILDFSFDMPMERNPPVDH